LSISFVPWHVAGGLCAFLLKPYPHSQKIKQLDDSLK
jgi:hypothetical protein